LDILMMYGAYSTSRGSAITRVLWRFCWFTVASFTICYLYVYVFLPFMSSDNFISTLLYKEISRMKDCTIWHWHTWMSWNTKEQQMPYCCFTWFRVNDEGNISGANQPLRANRANFNLGQRINIQGAWGDWIILQLTVFCKFARTGWLAPDMFPNISIHVLNKQLSVKR
jgi:hypothetical protein